MKRTIISFSAFVVVGSILLYFGIGLMETGALRAVVPHFKGDCKPIGPIAGSEDLEYSAKHKAFLISAGNFPEKHGDRTEDGAIFLLKLDGNSLTKITYNLGFDFHPHGIYLLENEKESLLWVINHHLDRSTVELFSFHGNVLLHEKTFESEMLGNANDIVAFSRDRFFITRDHQTDNHALSRFYDYVRIPNGSIVSFDSGEYKTQATGLTFANGIIPSQDGTKLLVAEMLRQKIHIYDILENNALKKVKTVALGSSPDNLSWDEDGHLWIGSHPNLLRLSSHSRDHKMPGPAEVLRVKNIFSDSPIVESIFTDDGSHVSAVSVAKRLEDRLVLGTIYDSKLLYCRIVPD